MTNVAALFVDHHGHYADVGYVDLWDEARDARMYPGILPVVAHPPCSSWCQLAHVNQKRYGHKVGDDGGCFAAALKAVRRWGGVLEHPAYSYAWPHFGLTRPPRGGWQRSIDGGWTAQVSQRAYGHRARKMTWLYYHGNNPPLETLWTCPEPEAQVSWCKNHGNSPLPRLSKREAAATPEQFMDLLLALARHSTSDRASKP